jgi:hypothetical protein
MLEACSAVTHAMEAATSVLQEFTGDVIEGGQRNQLTGLNHEPLRSVVSANRHSG